MRQSDKIEIALPLGEELEALVSEQREEGLAAVDEAVEDADVIARPHQIVDEGRAEIAGTAGDENLPQASRLNTRAGEPATMLRAGTS